MRTLGDADGPPTSRKKLSNAPPRRKYTSKQVSRVEYRWHPRGRQRRHENLMPMRTPGAVDGPPPSRERHSNATPLREYVTKHVSRLEDR